MAALDHQVVGSRSSVLFDLDGCLADSIPALYRVHIDFLASFGIAAGRPEFEESNGPALAEIVAHVKAKYRLRDTEQDLLARYKAKTVEAYQGEVKPFPGAGDVLEELKNRNYAMALVTSADQDLAKAFLDAHDFSRYFRVTVFGDEVERAKPSPEIYELALQRMNVASSSAVVVEDSCNGVRSAAATGAFVIGVESSQPGQALLAAGASLTVSRVKELLDVL